MQYNAVVCKWQTVYLLGGQNTDAAHGLYTVQHRIWGVARRKKWEIFRKRHLLELQILAKKHVNL